jgi:hypothetical protein
MELPATAYRYLLARLHHVSDTSAVPAPRPNLAGAQERSRCSPPRRNDLDRALALWRAVRSDDCRSLPETKTQPTWASPARQATKESDLANSLAECHQHSTGTQSTLQERLPSRYGCRLGSLGHREFVIRAEADQVPADYVLECLELGWILSSTDQLDAGRCGFEIADPEVELEPPAFLRELSLHLVTEVADQLFDKRSGRGVRTNALVDSSGAVN